jgi:hypothetical protein
MRGSPPSGEARGIHSDRVTVSPAGEALPGLTGNRP